MLKITRNISFINQKLMKYNVVMRIDPNFASCSPRKEWDLIYLEDNLWKNFSSYNYFYTLMYLFTAAPLGRLSDRNLGKHNQNLTMWNNLHAMEITQEELALRVCED